MHEEAFLVQKANYIMKVTGDTDFLQTFSVFREEFGFEMGRENPFVLPIRPLRLDISQSDETCKSMVMIFP